jgi:hypothetical protein
MFLRNAGIYLQAHTRKKIDIFPYNFFWCFAENTMASRCPAN